MFGGVYRNRRVLVTGHTGFKGSYLAEWLTALGAEVGGISLEPGPELRHFGVLKLPVRSRWLDIGDSAAFRNALEEFNPEIVFHLAAQPLVRYSYREPVETYRTNVMGTVHLLEAARHLPSLRAAVVVTSDKCYENRETGAPFRETDPMGGFDPYSSSKGCAELAAAAYRRSFFPPGGYGVKHHVLIATARAGNVIGGGDWAEDRLVPDLARAAADGRCVELRSPDAIRPWQHVFEPLAGYLMLGARLFAGDAACSGAWNFGPDPREGSLTVREAAALLARHWPEVKFKAAPVPDAPHEAGLLRLDCAKARGELRWRPVWSAAEAFERTAVWYREYYRSGRVNTAADRECYIKDAAARGAAWLR